MVLESLPDRPLPIEAVNQLPDGSEKINGVTPITVSELPDGRPTHVYAFVLSLDSSSIGWYAFAFNPDNEVWETVYEAVFESTEEAENRFYDASDAIQDFWEEHDVESTLDEVHETEDGEVEERTLRFE